MNAGLTPASAPADPPPSASSRPVTAGVAAATAPAATVSVGADRSGAVPAGADSNGPGAAGPGATGLGQSASSRLVLPLICAGQFMVSMDISVVNLALPHMKSDLGFSTAGLQWVITAYTLAFAGFLLLGGRAGDLFGRRRLFLIGVGIFTGASLVCGLAQSSDILLAARAVQGLGAAALSPATLTILTTTYTETRQRVRAISTWSATSAVGGASGALLAGLLIQLASWRWIFFINVPIGVVTMLVARNALVESRRAGTAKQLDVLGALTVTGGMLALIYAFSATDTSGWTGLPTVTSAVVAALLLSAFVAVESRIATSPLVPLGIFRSRSLSAANLSMILLNGSMFSFWYFLSQYLQEVRGYGAALTGVAFLPFTMIIVATAAVGSHFLRRVGARLPILIGSVGIVGGLAWLSRAGPTGTFLSAVVGAGIVANIGTGLVMPALSFAATAGVSPEQAGLASGVLNTTRLAGPTLCTAVLATVAASRTRAVSSSHGLALSNAVRLSQGYDRALLVAAVFALVGGLIALLIAKGDAEGALTGG